MAKRLAATFVILVHDATLKSFWRRKALWRFLRQAGIAESFLATWGSEESKREFLDRLSPKLPDQTKGLIIFAYKAFIPLVQGAFTWPGFAGKVFLTLTVGVLAAYAVSQGDKALEVERRSRKMALELEAIALI